MGFDPIELIGGREVLGDTDLAVDHEGLRYLFVSAENRARFLGDPGRYGVQLGGLCARLGRTTGGDQDLYSVFEGRIYVFASNHCVEVFEEAPRRFLEPAPPPPLRESATADALRRGDELIALAVDALGGAVAIDAVDSLVEEVVTQRAADGVLVDTKQSTVVDLAHRRLRRERSYAAGDFVEVWTPEASWWRGSGAATDYSPAQAANLAEELVIANPLYILSLRHREGFVAASRGEGAAQVLEHVDVEWDDHRWTLGVEPRTGMLASIAFTDRGPEGNWGRVVHFLTDYRAVGGVHWPHRRVVTFDGENVPWWNTRTSAVEVNVELAPELFRRPVAAGSR
jgi:hypothetical protein